MIDKRNDTYKLLEKLQTTLIDNKSLKELISKLPTVVIGGDYRLIYKPLVLFRYKMDTEDLNDSNLVDRYIDIENKYFKDVYEMYNKLNSEEYKILEIDIFKPLQLVAYNSYMEEAIFESLVLFNTEEQ